MPYWWRRPYRRRRRTWRRRFRGPFRRRWFWRRRYWVRRKKRKLPKINIKQWQPTTIKRLTIKGQYPLFSGTTERIGNDNTAYIDQIAPHEFPGGGLYSITIFTLAGLFELHEKARNWWTKSNCNLPLIRYLGGTIKLYPSSSVDYVTVPITCGELKATESMFQSTQPSVLMLNRRKRILLCKNYKHSRKSYKKIRLKPPSLLFNKWYFQKELANYPLAMIITSAASFDRYYLPASAVSETIGFTSLNTKFFEYHNFKQKTPVEPFSPSTGRYIFGIGGTHVTLDNAKRENLILLGNTLDFQTGKTIGSMSTTGTASDNWTNQVTNYFKSRTNWGNPFKSTWFDHDPDSGIIAIYTIQATEKLEDKLKSLQPNQTLKQQHFLEPTMPFYIQCRYNPQADTRKNATYVTRITEGKRNWQKPTDTHLYTEGLPLWCLLWGWKDFLLKSGTPQHLETDYIQVIISDHISPYDYDYYVPIDWFMIHDRSPYCEEGHIKPYDQQNWHPKCNFQMQSVSHILQSGPATAKLPPLISAEAHMTYALHFKVGGCPPKMDSVCDPKQQPDYPQPGNIISSILLQNPEYPIQYYISSFDERRNMLTERAAKRIKKDAEITETFFKPTGQTLMSLKPASPQTTSEEDTSEEEKSDQETQTFIHRQHRRQRKLQRRILELLRLTQNM
nr:MAG: ORF1 [TTV-like mini virus]